MLLLFCSQSGFTSRANTYSHCRTVFCSLPFSCFRGSIDESPLEQSEQQNPQRSRVAEQMSGELMQKERILMFWRKLYAHLIRGAVFEQHPAKLGALLSNVCFSFKRSDMVYRFMISVLEREGLNSYSM